MLPTERIVVTKNVSLNMGNGKNNSDFRTLNLMMICCEEDPPYGPATDTANMFMQLLFTSYNKLLSHNKGNFKGNITSIRMTIYHAQFQDYPSTKNEWDSFDGVIIPGSFSAAYDEHLDWIRLLHKVIREEIHGNRRKTLAICFGHQSLAHAFGMETDSEGNSDENSGCQTLRNGLAIPCPTGKKTGRKPYQLTSSGKLLLLHPSKKDQSWIEYSSTTSKKSLEMLFTHGDMIHTLPTVGLSLGGSDDVPVQAAAYFYSEEIAKRFQIYAESCESAYTDSSKLVQTIADFTKEHGPTSIPYAMTFQAHPEYSCPFGFTFTFLNVLQTMEKLGHISKNQLNEVKEDAELNLVTVLEDSLNAIVSVGIILHWFD